MSTSTEDDATQAIVNDKLVRKICDDVGTCWEDLGLELGLKLAVLRNVDTEKSQCREKAREIIRLWKQKEGKAATVKSFQDALLRIEKRSIAEALLDSHMALQNEGQREGAQAHSSRTRKGDGNRSDVNKVKTGDVSVGSNSTVIIMGNQEGSLSL